MCMHINFVSEVGVVSQIRLEIIMDECTYKCVNNGERWKLETKSKQNIIWVIKLWLKWKRLKSTFVYITLHRCRCKSAFSDFITSWIRSAFFTDCRLNKLWNDNANKFLIYKETFILPDLYSMTALASYIWYWHIQYPRSISFWNIFKCQGNVREFVNQCNVRIIINKRNKLRNAIKLFCFA